MKKSLFILSAVVTVSMGLTSCSKSYNCHCVYKTNGAITREDDSKINEGKREKSEAACNQGDSYNSVTLNGYTSVTETECTLN
jgi:hypothetical protein